MGMFRNVEVRVKPKGERIDIVSDVPTEELPDAKITALKKECD